MTSPLLKPSPRPKKAKRPIARTTRPSKIRKTARGLEKASLNDLWAKVIRLRDPQCRLMIWCKGAPTTEAAHLWPKSTHPRIRWDLRVGRGSCHPCHFWLDLHPHERQKWVERNLPPREICDLMMLGNSARNDRAAVRETLTAELRRLQG